MGTEFRLEAVTKFKIRNSPTHSKVLRLKVSWNPECNLQLDAGDARSRDEIRGRESTDPIAGILCTYIQVLLDFTKILDFRFPNLTELCTTFWCTLMWTLISLKIRKFVNICQIENQCRFF